MRQESYSWGGNFVRPAHGIVSDGNLLFVLAHVRPEFAGVLLQEYGEWEGCSECGTREFENTRDTEPEKAWKALDKSAKDESVRVSAGRAMTHTGAAVEILREDGRRACVRAELLAFARGVLPFDEMRQHGDEHKPILLYVGGHVGGALMPLRVRDLVMGKPDWTEVVLHTERPEMAR